MLVFRNSPSSPFGRQVRIAVDVLGLGDRVEVAAANTLDPDRDFLVQNPLGKIPILLGDDGTALHDSRVIVEYLDHLAGGGLLYPGGAARFGALVQQSLMNGLLDAALLQVYEGRYRPAEMHVATWLDMQRGKVERALARAEQAYAADEPAIHVGHIAQACALGYLDFRFAGEWRATYPNLVAWLDAFAARVPAFEATRPPPG